MAASSLAAAAAATAWTLLSHPCSRLRRPSLPLPPLPHRALRLSTRPRPAPCRSSGDHPNLASSRPPVIPWSKDLVNTVHLIGHVAFPVSLKPTPTGKVMAWTSLAVRRCPTETTWIKLRFWDDLASVAFHHVQKGMLVYVRGHLQCNTVEGPEKKQVFYQVVVDQLNLIDNSPQQVSLYNPGGASTGVRQSLGSEDSNWPPTIDSSRPSLEDSNRPPSGYSGGGRHGHDRSLVEMWQAFFAVPLEWWDNRTTKKNPKAPDFKHKGTGEALWIESRYNPPWVRSQLEILDSRMGSMRANERSYGGVSRVDADDILNF